GISKSGTVLDAGVEQSIIEKSGTWYTYKNERIGQGRENAKKWLQENPATLADLEAKIREALGLRPAALSKEESAMPIDFERLLVTGVERGAREFRLTAGATPSRRHQRA